MKLFTGLFRAARKRTMTTDNDMGMFRQKLDELVASKDTLSDEDIVAKVEELKGFTNDLPSDDDKAKLDRFLEDFKAIKEQDPATAKEAAGMVADLFEKLDTKAMQDVPATEEPAPEAEPTQEVEGEATEELVEGAAPEAAGEPAEDGAEEIAEETEIPGEGEATEDADPNAEYSLEEIYQFIKKRMAEDSACQDEAPAEEKDQEENKEEDEVVTDHAPFIPVTMNNKSATQGTLAQMFADIKGAR